MPKKNSFLICLKKTQQKTKHLYEGGLAAFVKHLNRKHSQLFDDPVHIKGEKENVPVELSLSYNETYSSNVLTFVNNINTIEGGTHLAGFKTALTRSLNKYANKNKTIKTKKKRKHFFKWRRCKGGDNSSSFH